MSIYNLLNQNLEREKERYFFTKSNTYGKSKKANMWQKTSNKGGLSWHIKISKISQDIKDI